MTNRFSFVLLPFMVFQELSAQQWLWSQQIGGPGDDRVRIAGLLNDDALFIYGNYAWPAGPSPHFNLFIGEDTLNGSMDAFLARYANDGTQIWVKDLSSPSGLVSLNSVVLDTVTERIYAAGSFTYTCVLDTIILSSPYGSGFLSQWDMDGHCLWARNVARNDYPSFEYRCEVGAVAIDSEGHVLAAGRIPQYGASELEGNVAPQGTFLASYSATGDTMWTKMISEYEGGSQWLEPMNMSCWSQAAFIYGGVYLATDQDTLVVDTFHLTGVEGGGYAVMRVDPETGSVLWFRAHGFPLAPAAPGRFSIDQGGHLYVAGGYVNAIFDSDTLSASNTWGNSYIAQYDSAGVLQWVKDFQASEGVNFIGMSAQVDTSLLVTGYVQGTGTWDSHPISTAERELVISQHTLNGECTNVFSEIPGAYGVSAISAADGLFISGRFATTPPYDSITIGGYTYTTQGWSDAFLAKHDLILGIATPNNLNDEHLLIYANPNSGSFRIQVPEALLHEQGLLLSVYDSAGHLVRMQSLNMQEEHPGMDIRDVGKGLYTVTLAKGDRGYSGSMVVE